MYLIELGKKSHTLAVDCCFILARNIDLSIEIMNKGGSFIESALIRDSVFDIKAQLLPA